MSHQEHHVETFDNSAQSAKPTPHFLANLFGKGIDNLKFQSKWLELNGAMGDLGTYIPIVIALTLAKDLNLGTTLIFTGIYNIITGLIYGVPMPVQPMKSIAAVAISSSNEEFGIPEIMAAGIGTGGILFFLGITGLMSLVYKIIPLPVVRGVQLSQGLSFALTSVKYIRKTQNFTKGKTGVDREWPGLDGLVLALVCAGFIIIVNGAGEETENESRDREDDRLDSEIHSENSNKRTVRRKLWRIIFSLPSAVIVFLLGIILAFIRQPGIAKQLRFGPSSIGIVKISRHAWKQGFIKGTIPQLPLSVLNSVIAVCKLSSDLFPGKDFSAASISVTVGLMNLAGCWLGAMPVCHGAGGLAGQYKFGGRSGGCVAIIGAAKLVLGLVLGSSLVKILAQFPVGLLGVLLLFAGIELAMTSKDMNTKEEAFVMLVCTAVSLGYNAAVGFVGGILLYLLLKIRNLSNGEKPSFRNCFKGNP
ncbi:hypothetical protein MKW98_009691 [Papaver atlanticum]|uniref:Molybdate transporter 1 n=1 Tax=Papaver atlanticum TaxID=357466 RepID=A0AAD4SV21_9MAGN|nr:hypothetical protein MKW98_009691 [Papaver atlanticum]